MLNGSLAKSKRIHIPTLPQLSDILRYIVYVFHVSLFVHEIIRDVYRPTRPDEEDVAAFTSCIDMQICQKHEMTIAKHPKTKQLSSVNGCRFTQKLFTKNIQTYPVLVGKTLYKMKGPGVKTCENSPAKLICMFKFTSTMMTKSCALLGLLSRYVGNTTAKKSH